MSRASAGGQDRVEARLSGLAAPGDRPGGSLPRQLAAAGVLFGVLVGAIIFAFGHLISQSLSRRYLEDILITGREEAERIASELGPEPVRELDVLVQRREQLVRTLQGLDRRKVIESFEVTDSSGEVVFTGRLQTEEAVPAVEAAPFELGAPLRDDVVVTSDSYRISVPLGEVGEVVLNVSRARVAERVALLQRELRGQTAMVAGLTLATLAAGFVFVGFLVQRTRRAEARRRESEELAALGTLAANLAHEIRNPLNSINLNLELLEEDLAGQAEAARSLTSTRQEVTRLARLVSDFLTYARPTAPVLEVVRVRALLEEVVAFLRGEARGMGTHLRLLPEVADPGLRGDPGQLRQVMLNLVLNAVQSVAQQEKAERRVVEIGAREDGGAVILMVRDRGDGIRDIEIDDARRAFFTRRRGGSGLGLAIAERIVAAHGGRLELENLEPQGFEARVVLPLPGGDGTMSR